MSASTVRTGLFRGRALAAFAAGCSSRAGRVGKTAPALTAGRLTGTQSLSVNYTLKKTANHVIKTEAFASDSRARRIMRDGQ